MPRRTHALLAPRTLDDMLLYRLTLFTALGAARVIRLCEAGFGITRREWRILALLAASPGLQSAQLAERVGLDRPRTSRAITSLVAKKLVRRVVAEGDRRRATLALTEAGRTLYGRLFPEVAAIHRRLLAPLTRDEVVAFGTMLDRLQAGAVAWGRDAEPDAASGHAGAARASGGRRRSRMPRTMG